MASVVGKGSTNNEGNSAQEEEKKTGIIEKVKPEEESKIRDGNEIKTEREENGLGEVNANPEIEVTPKDRADFTVFVGKLSDRVSAEELKEFFVKETKAQEGEVAGVNLPWKVVKKSKKLGIAFVDFTSQRVYEAALTLNGHLLHGQNILVLPAAKTHQGLLLMDGPEGGDSKDGSDADSTAKSKNANNTSGYVPVYKKSDHVAYIKNLPHGVTEDEVLEFFKFTRTDIVDIAIPIPFKAKRNAKRPVRAIIAFPTEESLQKCLTQTKTMFREREVVVERHQMVAKVTVGEKRPASNESNETASPEKQPKIAPSAPAAGSAETPGQMELDLFVKHIPREASDRQIKDFFGSVGATVVKVNLFSESVTGSTRGMGFVSMADKESVQKGLALDCKRFYKNKVRVSVRRDREHLDRPDKGEALPNFSTFVANLPIKEKAEVLKQALMKHFEAADCTVKDLNVPLAPNRSGNRGYAFVVFADENSLKKGQGLNSSEVKLPNNKITISVSDRWPENPTDAPAGEKGKQPNERGVQNAQQEPPGSGKQRKRKKGGPVPLVGGVPQGGPGPQGPGPKGPPENSGPQPPNRWNFPPDFQPDGPEYNPYGSDYQDYLEYLEYRDYVAMRKAYDERRELAEYRARYRPEREDEFMQQQQSMQSSMPPPPPPTNQGTPGSSGYSRSLGGVRKEGRPDDEYRGYSYSSSGRGDRGNYEGLPSASGSATSSRSREYRDFDYMGARGSSADTGGFSSSGTGGSGGYGGGSGGGGGGSSSYMAADRGSGGYSYSESFTSSLNSSRYQTADSSFSRSRLLDNSGVGSSALGFSRESSTTVRDSANGIDSASRGGGHSNYGSSFASGSAGDIRGSHSSLTGTAGSSNLRSSALDSGRSQYGPMSYSGLDRASASYSGGHVESSGFGSSGGSYSGGDASRYSYPSGSSLPTMQEDRHRYSGYPMSSADLADQRKGPMYDRSEASRLGSSGNFSNTVYEGYSGLSGYRAG